LASQLHLPASASIITIGKVSKTQAAGKFNKF